MSDLCILTCCFVCAFLELEHSFFHFQLHLTIYPTRLIECVLDARLSSEYQGHSGTQDCLLKLPSEVNVLFLEAI